MHKSGGGERRSRPRKIKKVQRDGEGEREKNS